MQWTADLISDGTDVGSETPNLSIVDDEAEEEAWSAEMIAARLQASARKRRSVMFEHAAEEDVVLLEQPSIQHADLWAVRVRVSCQIFLWDVLTCCASPERNFAQFVR